MHKLIIYITTLLLIFSFTYAAYDPDCVADADCWARQLAEAAGITNTQNTQVDCNSDCRQYHGANSYGENINGVCQCYCKPGFEEDNTLTCVRSQSSCDQDCKTYHSADKMHGPNAYGKIVNRVCQCRCSQGYEPDENLFCKKIQEPVFDEDDFDGFEEFDDTPTDAHWETFEEQCNNLSQFSQGGSQTFTVTQQELIMFIKKVEAANPDYNWKQIVSALHANRYPNDLGSVTFPIIGTPLFINGQESDGWQDVNLICNVTLQGNSEWYTPKFVLSDDGRKIELGHAYGAVRINMNRKPGLFGSAMKSIFGRDPSEDLAVMAITHYGDAWQVLIHNVLLREPGTRAPPDQVYGNNMGIWLNGYYNNPQNQNKPLSVAFDTYFNR